MEEDSVVELDMDESDNEDEQNDRECEEVQFRDPMFLEETLVICRLDIACWTR